MLSRSHGRNFASILMKHRTMVKGHKRKPPRTPDRAKLYVNTAQCQTVHQVLPSLKTISNSQMKQTLSPCINSNDISSHECACKLVARRQCSHICK